MLVSSRNFELTLDARKISFAAIEKAATLLTGFPEVFVYERDPDDAQYINLALAAGAQLIVSRDKDLLDLMDIGRPESAVFQSRFPELRILNPVGFLREMGGRL
ncbi:MAG: hypothetical protein M3O30_09195 [Planctomycetota bacterium]|nr:hypothetical protein [Planctomycetota bacterium]